ncbi:hypothetical protein ACOKGD_04635 [Microbacterium phosphatis]|uniref:hypothetical protein n=1 Tax=Microbacterium phosphatis TaxID=3140248 RepID=UPI00314069F0
MIYAALILLAVGGVDLVRTVFRRAGATPLTVGFGVVMVLAVLLGLLAGAPAAGIAGAVVAGLWLWLMPDRGHSPVSIWPAAGVGVLSALSILLVPAEHGTGAFGRLEITSPLGELTLPGVLMMVGALAYLLESANVVVRAALERENIAPSPDPVDEAEAEAEAVAEAQAAMVAVAEPPPSAPVAEAVPAPSPVVQPALAPGQVMRGGRLIGPLERAIVFGLTLAAAYPLLAAFIAAKGIVRFPEISRDGDGGDRAEYFLVGSMVSWVQALSGAFLVWWGLRS